MTQPRVPEAAIAALMAETPGLGAIQARNQIIAERTIRAAMERTRHSRRFA